MRDKRHHDVISKNNLRIIILVAHAAALLQRDTDMILHFITRSRDYARHAATQDIPLVVQILHTV